MASAQPYQSLSRTFSVDGAELPWAAYFQSLQVAKSITDHPDRAILHFLGMSPEAVQKAALAANKNLQFKWGNGNNQSIPHSYVIHAVDTQYIGTKAMARIHLIDSRVHLMANSAFSSYPHQSFSQIVSSVVKSYSGLPAPVVRADKYIADVLQTGSHHWAFLSALKREGCKASDTGNSDYRLFFRGGNELHFHPPDYTQAPYRTIQVGSTIAPEVNLRRPPWKSILGGSVGYTSGNFSRDGAQPLSAKSNETSAQSQSGATPIPSNFTGAFLGKFFHAHHPTKPLLEKTADVGAADALHATDSLELTLEGDPGMEPGCLIRLNHKDTASSAPMDSDGLWLVEHVFHDIYQSSLGRTKVKLSRTKSSSVGNQPIRGLNSATAGQGSLSNYNGTFSGNGGTVVKVSNTVKV